MLTTEDIVKINLSVNQIVDEAVEYDTGLIIGTTATSKLKTDSSSPIVKKYYSVSEMLDDDFVETDPEYTAALLYFSQSPAPQAVFVAYWDKTAHTTIASELDAIYQVDGSWWGVFVCGITASDIVACNTYLAASETGLLFYSVKKADTFADDGTIKTTCPFAQMKVANSRRTAGILYENDKAAVALMGRICGLHHANPDGSFSACYKDLNGVDTVKLTAAQVKAVQDVGASVYVTRGYKYNVVQKASTGSGLRIDEVLYLDVLRSELREAALGVMITNGNKLAQVDSTSTIFKAVLSQVLIGFLNRGVIATGTWGGSAIGGIKTGTMLTDGYYIYIDTYSNQSLADREAHKAMPISIAIVLAGSVESVEINVDVQR